jgi:hypothetical protein
VKLTVIGVQEVPSSYGIEKVSSPGEVPSVQFCKFVALVSTLIGSSLMFFTANVLGPTQVP